MGRPLGGDLNTYQVLQGIGHGPVAVEGYALAVSVVHRVLLTTDTKVWGLAHDDGVAQSLVAAQHVPLELEADLAGVGQVEVGDLGSGGAHFHVSLLILES